jgi:hypothetical protein
MLANRHPKLVLKISPWCAAVCLLLAVLFLYNPFFTIYNSPGVRSVSHPLSFRGTVASSELRRSLVTKVQPQTVALDEAVLDAVRLPEASSPSAVAMPDEPLRSTQEAVLEGLWFRPPPLLSSFA